MTATITALSRKVAVVWLIALAVVALVAIAAVRTTTDHTIKWRKVEVSGRVRFCNPPNADGNSASICIYRVDDPNRLAHVPWLNRMGPSDNSQVDVFATSPVTMWIANMPGEDTPSVFRAEAVEPR